MNSKYPNTIIVNNYFNSDCKLLYQKLKRAGIGCEVKDIPITKTLNWSKLLMADCLIRYKESDKIRIDEVIAGNETKFESLLKAYTSN